MWCALCVGARAGGREDRKAAPAFHAAGVYVCVVGGWVPLGKWRGTRQAVTKGIGDRQGENIGQGGGGNTHNTQARRKDDERKIGEGKVPFGKIPLGKITKKGRGLIRIQSQRGC